MFVEQEPSTKSQKLKAKSQKPKANSQQPLFVYESHVGMSQEKEGVGTYQEFKAEKTMEALANLVNVNSKVLRNGNVVIVPARELVPGDIVILDSRVASKGYGRYFLNSLPVSAKRFRIKNLDDAIIPELENLGIL